LGHQVIASIVIAASTVAIVSKFPCPTGREQK
jgi:hypothetical protein